MNHHEMINELLDFATDRLNDRLRMWHDNPQQGYQKFRLIVEAMRDVNTIVEYRG